MSIRSRFVRHGRCIHILASATLLSLAGSTAGAAPTGPGLTIVVHDSLPDPIGMTFGSDGAMYVGRDNSFSGGGNADSVRIHRIAPGGGSHRQYGVRATWDPDAVFFDATGQYSGVAGSVIVGGRPAGSATGVVSAIRPDESVVTLAGPNAGFVNPSDFVVDPSGRLLFTDFEGTGAVQQMTGGAPSPYFSPGTSQRDIAVHPVTGEIYLRNTNANVIRRFTAAGTLIATVVSGIPGTGMAFGTGGVWGQSLYVASGTRVLRVNSAVSRDTVASGFAGLANLEFGPDGSMYVSDFSADKIYRLNAATAGVDGPVPSRAIHLAVVGAQPSLGETRLRFQMPRAGRISLCVFDVAGREVIRLQDGETGAGEHELAWDGRDAQGHRMSPGVYLARLLTDSGSATARLVRAR